MTVHVPESRIRRDAAAHRMMEAIRTGEGEGMAWIGFLAAAAERGACAEALPRRMPGPSSPPHLARRENDMSAVRTIIKSFTQIAIAMAIFWTVAVGVIVFAAMGFGTF